MKDIIDHVTASTMVLCKGYKGIILKEAASEHCSKTSQAKPEKDSTGNRKAVILLRKTSGYLEGSAVCRNV